MNKKHLTLTGIILLILTTLTYSAAPTVTINSPNGGEIWSGVNAINFNVSDADADDLTANLYIIVQFKAQKTGLFYQIFQ